MKGLLTDAPAHWGFIPPKEARAEAKGGGGSSQFAQTGSASFYFNFANRGDGRAAPTRGVPKEGCGYEESGLREVAEEYYALVDRMARRLLPVLALGLGLPREYFAPAFEKTVLSAAVNHQ